MDWRADMRDETVRRRLGEHLDDRVSVVAHSRREGSHARRLAAFAIVIDSPQESKSLLIIH